MDIMQAIGERAYSCACRGPQNGQPYCPCKMRDLHVVDGRYVQDMGPVKPARPTVQPMQMVGCICPAGAEKTCQGPTCPRRPLSTAAVA